MSVFAITMNSITPYSVECSPVNCMSFEQEVSPAEAVALVSLTANKSSTVWTFDKTAGDIAVTGATSGATTTVALTASAIGTKSATYNVTATLGVRTVITPITLTAAVDV